MRRVTSPKRTWACFEGHQSHILEATTTPRLVVLTGILCMLLVVLLTSGCESISRYTEEHPQVVAGASIAALAVGGVMMGKAISRSGQAPVTPASRTRLGPP